MAVKWVAMLAVTLLGVFGVSMSSQANRTFVMQKVDEILDNGKNTVVNNSGKTIQDDNKDEEVIEKKSKKSLKFNYLHFFIFLMIWDILIIVLTKRRKLHI